VEPVTEIFHGVSVTDPYRWLEDQDSPQTRSWIEEQTLYARAYLHSIPGRIKAKLLKLTGRRRPTTAPFGEHLPGEWADYATTKKYLAYQFKEYFRFTQNKKQIFWVDIYAKWLAE